MSYLKRLGTRRVPQSALPAAGPGAELGRRLRLGRRRLDAAAPLPDPRLRGRLVLRRRVDADARERAGGRASASREDGPRAVAEIVARLDRGPRAEERPGALRARDGGRRWATRRRAGPRSTALPQVARTGTHLFQFATFVEGFRGWGRSLRRAVGGWYAAQAGRRARLPGGQVPPARRRDAPRPAAPGAPGRAGGRGQPDARRLGRARAAVRVDRPRRRDGRPAAPSSRASSARRRQRTPRRGGRARPRVPAAARGA